MFIALFAILLPAFTFAFESNFFVSTDLGLEGQAFDITSINLPPVTYGGQSFPMKLIQDTNYLATLDITDSTYSPVSKTDSNAVRLTFGAGFDTHAGGLITLRLKAFSSFGDRALVNKQYYMYAPGVTTDLINTDGVELPGVVEYSTEMIKFTQGPNYGIFVAPLYRLSDRFSIGPSYAISHSKISSSEYLNAVNGTSGASTSIPFYVGTFTVKNQAFGGLWVYQITHQTSMHIGIESSKQNTFAQKEIYFTGSGSSIVRDNPSSTSSTSSNWNAISCSKDTCTCNAGSDCGYQTGSTLSYDNAPHLHMTRLLTRISIGMDFSVGSTH